MEENRCFFSPGFGTKNLWSGNTGKLPALDRFLVLHFGQLPLQEQIHNLALWYLRP